ncbi:ORF6N domain-containing protein [uncultured Eudoraea sp.]|uniref:ORF6N domain-containing protein n=1 Tax=uncultured Eudoraea sp. TaxID=1035614 RepID=UPI00260EAABF|nr:ORF6N domain-containing protein [uncultured Eudoraea sp.]
MPKKTKALIAEETIVRKIIRVRGERVVVDRDLAEMYGVETRVLNQAVSRNIKRFPEDFMYTLTLLLQNDDITNCDIHQNKIFIVGDQKATKKIGYIKDHDAFYGKSSMKN